MSQTRTLGLAFVLACAAAAAHAEDIAPAREKELIRLVRQDCGSCHGLTLRGGLGPALTAPALKDRPAGMLKHVILWGKPGTPMPPWGRFLTEAEAEWIVTRLMKGFPDER